MNKILLTVFFFLIFMGFHRSPVVILIPDVLKYNFFNGNVYDKPSNTSKYTEKYML